MDRPKDGVFRASDWRIRYRVIGSQCEVVQDTPNRFRFRLGDWQACVLTFPIRFDGQDRSWAAGHDDDGPWLDAVLYHGQEREWPIAELGETTVAAALELVAPGNEPHADVLLGMQSPVDFRYEWGDLVVEMPARPFPGV